MNEDEAKGYIPDKFEEIAREIWGDSIIDQMEIKFEISEDKVNLAGLAAVRSRFSARRCHGFFKKNIFIANPALFTYDKKDIDRVLIHEAVHLGIHRHDTKFHSICLKHGGTLTKTHLKENKIKLQIKKGTRYIDLVDNGKTPTFDTLELAKYYGKIYMCAHPEARLRAFY